MTAPKILQARKQIIADLAVKALYRAGARSKRSTG